jgi:hypothetical protein
MPNVSPKKNDRNFNMRVDQAFDDAVDELRLLMRPIPSKSDAVRAAVFSELSRLRKSAVKGHRHD